MAIPAVGPISVSTGALRIGGNAVGGDFFEGLIDEVRVYKRALSGPEIQADMLMPLNATSNRVPVLTTPDPQTGTEGIAVVALTIDAADPDGDPLTYSAAGLPNGVTIKPTTGVISGIVGFDAAATNLVVITVDDGSGGSGSVTFIWTITLVNRSPVVTNPGPQTGTEGVAVTVLPISATDADGNKLTYSATGRPSGISINATTGVMSGTVGFGAKPKNNVKVTVTDGNGGTASTTFAWTITLVNRPPVVTTPGPQSGTEGQAVTPPLAIAAFDPDADTLTYSATGLPNGLSIHSTTGVVSGTVAFNASAAHMVVVTINDGHLGTASTGAFSWTIVLVNQPPTITTPAPQTGMEGVAVAPLVIGASDPDGDVLTYTAAGLPSGLSIGATTGAISGTVAFDALATNSVEVNVSDGTAAAATAIFSWTIVKTPPAVVRVMPVAEAMDVSPHASLTATFSRAMDISSVSSTTFSLRTATNVPIAAVISYNVATNTATLVPSSELPPGACLTAMIKGGSTGVRDVAGNALATDVLWSFTIEQPGSGLVAAYGFDEGGGALATDASGHGNAGTITGGAWKVGKFGKSLAFDGLRSWVTIAASDSVNLTTAMTIEAWVYATEAGGSRTVLFKEAPGQGGAHSYALYSTFGVDGPGGHVLLAEQVNAHAPAAIALNRWTHLATSYDGHMLRSYVDGVERMAIVAAGPINLSDGALRIGGNAMWGEFFHGRIDEVRLYNRALPVSEIQRDMTTPVTGWLVAAYSFDAQTGPTVTDDAGRSLTGTISGAAWTASGRFGGALQFDGVDDWMTVADSSWLDVGREITLEAWVYPTAAGGSRNVLIKEAAESYTYALYADGLIGPSAGATTGSNASATTPTALALDTWSHLAATYDGATLRLFVNGDAVASTPVTGLIAISSEPLRIGGNRSWGEHFAGVIDEVRIYNRALSLDEIRKDMATPISGGPDR
jgi:hypothetical protein